MVAALLIVLGGGLMATFLTGQASFVSSEAYIQVQQEARRALDQVVRELREAGPAAGATPIEESAVVGGSNQLNFQIARGYNAADCANAICWGSETAVNDWVHYAVVQPAGVPHRQLVRCVRAAGADSRTYAVPATGAGCSSFRVLANYVNTVVFDANNGVVTVTMAFQYQNARIAGGSQQLGTAAAPLSARVRLRNP